MTYYAYGDRGRVTPVYLLSTIHIVVVPIVAEAAGPLNCVTRRAEK